MMKKLSAILRRDPVLTVAALAALLSMLLTPPDAEYLGYLNLRVLALLFCLMAVVAGLRGIAMLAPFTDNARGLLLGVNIGGLGTPVASMASLISYKLYAAAPDAGKGRYLAFFSAVNFGLLAVLLLLIR